MQPLPPAAQAQEDDSQTFEAYQAPDASEKDEAWAGAGAYKTSSRRAGKRSKRGRDKAAEMPRKTPAPPGPLNSAELLPRTTSTRSEASALSCVEAPKDVPSNPLVLCEDKELSQKMVERLKEAGEEERRQLIAWLLQAAPELALQGPSTRVIQEALQVADGQGKGREQLVRELEPHLMELMNSPHGNHVLTKIIEIMPPTSLKGLLDGLQKQDAIEISQHRFGCRVMERLIEHCPEYLIKDIIDKVVEKAESLAKHKYGNFVIQHLLEHGAPYRRACILQQLLQFIPSLAIHRSASHVVQRALEYSSEDWQRKIVETLLQSPGGQETPTLTQVACSRYGSFVTEQLVDMDHQGLVRERLAYSVGQLETSEFGYRVAKTFKIEVQGPPPESNEKKDHERYEPYY